VGGKQRRLICRWKPGAAPKRSPAVRISGRSGRIVGLCRLSKPSLEQEVTWDRTPLGLETAAPCQPRAALAAEGSERRWNPRNSKVPALHREA